MTVANEISDDRERPNAEAAVVAVARVLLAREDSAPFYGGLLKVPKQ